MMTTEREPTTACQEKPTRKRSRWLPDSLRQPVTLPMAISQLMAAAVGILAFWQVLAVGTNVEYSDSFILIIITPVLFFLQVAVHEFGHLVMALTAGLRVIQVKVGPLLLLRAGRKFRLRSGRSLAGTLGHVAAVPVTERGMRWRMGLHIVGGPLVSLLVGCLCLGLAPSFNDSFPSPKHFPYPKRDPGIVFFTPRTLAAGCLNLAGLLGLGLGCISFVPIHCGAIPNDGFQLFALFAMPRSKRDFLLAVLGSNMATGTRPRDWEPTMVERLVADRDGSPADAPSNLYGYYHALDSGRLKEAGQFLDLALVQHEGYPIGSREALFLEGAYFEARYRRNLTAARAWLEQCKPGVAEKQTWSRAEAAVLWAEGRYAEAAAHADAGLEAIPRSIDLGGRLAEKEQLEELLDACHNSTTDARGERSGDQRRASHSSSQA